jgi:amino acid transporter
MIIFVISIFAFFTGLFYVMLFLVVKFIQSFRKTNFKANKKMKHAILISSVVVALLTSYFFLFTSPSTNFRTAYIENNEQSFKVTVKGKRSIMVHDPVSIFLRKTYQDSEQFIIPHSEGIFKGHELLNNNRYSKSVGELIIKDNHLKIDLYTDYNNMKTFNPSFWNGNYELVWR